MWRDYQTPVVVRGWLGQIIDEKRRRSAAANRSRLAVIRPLMDLGVSWADAKTAVTILPGKRWRTDPTTGIKHKEHIVRGEDGREWLIYAQRIPGKNSVVTYGFRAAETNS